MAEDLDRLVDSIEGEGPSSEFVATLRARIVAETAALTPTIDEPVVELDLQFGSEERVSTPTQWMLVGLVAAAIAMTVGFVALTGVGRGGGTRTINPADGSTTIAPTTVTTTLDEPATFDAGATPLTVEYSLLDETTYRVDTLGTPFSFTVDQPLSVQPNDRAYVTLSHPGNQGPGDRTITLTRLTALSDPAQPTAPLDELGDGWPAGDFTGWLENLTDEMLVTARRDTTLGGLDAIRVDLEVGETDCRPGRGPCMPFGTNRLVNTIELYSGAQYRIWMVDQGDQSPLAVIVGIDRIAESEWFDTADAVLSTLAFGETAPNPILDVDAGSVELPFLGGVRIDLSEDLFAMREPGSFDQLVHYSWPARTTFLRNPADGDGNTLETPDDLVAALRSAGSEVTEIDTRAIDGIEARVFDVAGTASSPAPEPTPGATDGWPPAPRGRVWALNHPDRGLLMITAEASENLDIVFPIVTAETEQIIGSLEFVDLG